MQSGMWQVPEDFNFLCSYPFAKRAVTCATSSSLLLIPFEGDFGQFLDHSILALAFQGRRVVLMTTRSTGRFGFRLDGVVFIGR